MKLLLLQTDHVLLELIISTILCNNLVLVAEKFPSNVIYCNSLLLKIIIPEMNLIKKIKIECTSNKLSCRSLFSSMVLFSIFMF